MGGRRGGSGEALTVTGTVSNEIPRCSWCSMGTPGCVRFTRFDGRPSQTRFGVTGLLGVFIALAVAVWVRHSARGRLLL